MADARGCALLTCRDLEGFTHDEDRLLEPLSSAGWNPRFVVWDSKPNWNEFDAVLIRTTWDYTERLDEYLGVLEEIERSRARLFNPLETVSWNAKKRYLARLWERGFPVVPTCYCESPSEVELARERFQSKVVVKPEVGASGFGVEILGVGDEFPRIERPVIVQPLMESIRTFGEASLHYFGGKFSHAIRKVSRKGEIRCQEEHGGEIYVYEPSPEERACADLILDECDGQNLLFARVDLIVDAMKGPLLMEVELIEPALYLRFDDQAAPRLVEALDASFQSA